MALKAGLAHRKGNLFVISGPSGAGKGTLVEQLMKRIPDAWLSVSMTTRSPREGEVEGKSYYFVSEDEFIKTRDQGGLLEWADVHGHYYGTPRSKVLQKIAEGRQIILEIDPQGAFQVREKLPSAILVFILPPSFQELERRLRARATEGEEDIQRRLADARQELELAPQYDVRVTNDKLEDAIDKLVGIVDGYADAL